MALPALAEAATPTPAAPVPARYRLEGQPFSPTLAHLFDQARLVVLPQDRITSGGVGGSGEYAFSAVDRYGRLYHFDRYGGWWMDAQHALARPLPAEGWEVAWNGSRQTLELLVTEPWVDQDRVQLYWRDGNQWRRFEVSAAPAAKRGLPRLFLSRGRWICGGGRSGDGSAIPLRLLEGRQWIPFADLATTATAAAAEGPEAGTIGRLLGEASDGGAVALTEEGEVWKLGPAARTRLRKVPMEGLRLARLFPQDNRLLMVWELGLGRDKIASFELEGGEGEPHLFSQIAQLSINEENTGEFGGWGRMVPARGDRASSPTFTPWDEATTGAAALRLEGEAGSVDFEAEGVQLVELPPDLASLCPEAAAWVPALDGVVVPTRESLGLNLTRAPFGPAVTAREGGETTATATGVDVIERGHRFWVFKGDLVEFLKPPHEIHPAIGHLHSYETPDSTRRSLSWIYPEPGVFRYEFHASSPQNEQWLASEPLDLRGLPLLKEGAEAGLHLCDPVVWGDPAQVVLVGWSGRLGKLHKFDRHVDGLQDEAYDVVPGGGFMARINALAPERWEVSELPIPFCQGARLIVDSVRDDLYLVGGKMAVHAKVGGQDWQFMISNADVWRWDGSRWRRIEPGGDDPSMKITSDLAYHPGLRQLLGLTPRRLYGFDARNWNELWDEPSSDRLAWPEQVGLYVHPETLQTLGIWYLNPPVVRVWEEKGWVPVTLSGGRDVEGLPDRGRDFLPAQSDGSFVTVDVDRLAAIRMNARRDRDQDRALTAWQITLAPASGGR